MIGVHDAAGKPEQIEQVIREKDVKYPVFRDTEARETFAGYRITGIPHLTLVGKDGKILADGKSLQEMERRIQQELGAP